MKQEPKAEPLANEAERRNADPAPLPEEQLQNAAGGKSEESVTDTDPAYTDPKTAHPSEPVR